MTPNRWTILAILFLARLTMAFQFQSVAALSPLLMDRFALDLAGIGLLIGLYLAPGILVALPGGAIAARFGDKRVVGWAMAAMLAGALVIAFSGTAQGVGAGRLLAGAGGVVLNVVMTKMLVDWFTGHEIATALAVFINSWPVGIALALFLLPALGDLALAHAAICAVIAAGLLLFLARYTPPPRAGTAAAPLAPAPLPWLPLLLASLIWALYNAALAIVFSFGAPLLAERGWSTGEASSVIGLFMAVFALTGPLGGVLADRSGRRDLVILASFCAYLLVMPLALRVTGTATAVLLIGAGAIFALGAGPIMSLPSTILPAPSRAFGMGVFFTIYYAVMMAAPRIAGGLADSAGTVAAAFGLGIALCAVCLAALALFRVTARTPLALHP